jgi:class 3 adenylate cyclase
MRQNYMVAVCDVLGFSRLVETKSLDDVVNGAFGWLRQALHHSLHKREFPAEIPSKDEFLGNDHVGVAWFSDTILLYTLRDDEEAIRQLIQTVEWLLFETMMGSNTRIRGGISFGEAYIDEKDTVFIGKPVIEAYRLEQQQQWSGVALTKSACDRIPARVHSGHLGDWWVIPYDVPLKKKQTLRTLAINWTWGVHPLSWQFRWSASAELPTSSDWSSDPDICEKFMNTKAFHDEFCWNCNPK